MEKCNNIMVIKLTLFIMLACLFVSACAENDAEHDVDLFWFTTYDCDEWTQSQGNPNCDGLAFYGGWTCNGDEEQITSAANYPDGNGGKGQRHWVGDGVNQNSGSLKKEFSFVQSELWIRWYMRYESGFKWNPLGYDKWLYIDVGDNDAVIPQWYGSDKVNIHSAVYGNDGQNHPSPEGNGWNTIMNGPTSDGQFHCYEIHIKMDTNGYNGVAEMWVDGVKKIEYTDVDYGTTSGWAWFVIGSNQSTPDNGRNMYVDFDDIAVSNAGYIGPIPVTNYLSIRGMK